MRSSRRSEQNLWGARPVAEFNSDARSGGGPAGRSVPNDRRRSRPALKRKIHVSSQRKTSSPSKLAGIMTIALALAASGESSCLRWITIRRSTPQPWAAISCIEHSRNRGCGRHCLRRDLCILCQSVT